MTRASTEELKKKGWILVGEYPAPKPTRFELNMWRYIPIEQAVECEQFPAVKSDEPERTK